MVIRSGQLMIDESRIATSRTGSAEDALNGLSKAEIDIHVVNDVVVDNKSNIELSVRANSSQSPNPDRININTGHLEIGNGSIIQSSVLPNSTGSEMGDMKGGDVILKANSILMRDAESQVTTSAGGLVGGGDILVDVMGEIAIRGSSILQTFTSDEAGKAGDIQVKADKIKITHEIFNGPPPTFLSGFLSSTGIDSKGNAGNIHIETNDLQMIGGFVTTFTETGSEGQAGNIELLIDGDFSLIGNDNGGNVLANTLGEGNAGSILLQANNLLLTNDAQIQSATAGPGNASIVEIKLAGNVIVEEASSIDSTTFSEGAAGNINLTAKDVFINGLADAIDPADREVRTGLSVASNPGTGPGGSITINADNLQVTNKGSIRSVTLGPGAGGDINVMVGELSLTNGAVVTAESISSEEGTANAGNIDLKADGTILLDNSIVTTQADNAVGGNIKLDAGKLIQLTDSQVTSRVREGSGEAGSINFDPEFIVVQNSRIDSSADIGDGGDVTFVADSAILFDSLSIIDTSSRFGGNGIVDVQAPIQNLSGTIAPLPEETVPVTALYAARCAAGQSGHFSTFVDSKTDSLTPTPGRFLSSPLLLSSAEPVSNTSSSTKSPVMLTASIVPLVLGQAGEPRTACP